jgi:hypothetical protein
VGVSQTLEILQNENPHVPLLPRDIYNARAAINRNPDKVASALAENRPAIYSKPQPSAEERIRADLRRELQKAKEELEKVKSDSEKQVEALKRNSRRRTRSLPSLRSSSTCATSASWSALRGRRASVSRVLPHHRCSTVAEVMIMGCSSVAFGDMTVRGSVQQGFDGVQAVYMRSDRSFRHMVDWEL